MENDKHLLLSIESKSYDSWLFLHDWHEMPTGHEWNTVQIYSRYWYAISYSNDTYLLLEKPYSTDCLNYHIQTEYLSQKDCFRTCLLRESIYECDSIPKETNLFEGEFKNLINKHFDKNCSKSTELRNRCLYLCRKMDCVIYSYKPYAIASGLESKDGLTAVLISIPMGPKRIYRYYPKIETIEFLCYFASILSLWFGFSFQSIYLWIDKLRKWFKNKFNKKLISLNIKINSGKKFFTNRHFQRY